MSGAAAQDGTRTPTGTGAVAEMAAGREVADWWGLFAYHAEDRWNALLVGPLRECALIAEESGCRFRLTREWQRGPHLRLGVRGPAEAAATARARIDQRLREVLAESPSTRTVTLADVRERAQRMADRAGLELDQDWLADNSLTWTAGTTEVTETADVTGTAGTGTAGTTDTADATDATDMTEGAQLPVRVLLEDFHYAATVPALRLLRAAPGERLGPACADLMAVTAQEFGRGGPASAALSFRSHAEAYLNLDAAAGVRAAWDTAALRSAPDLRSRLLAVTGADMPAYARDWLQAITPVVRAAEQAQQRGVLALPTMAEGFSPALTERSAFHRALAGSASWEEVRTSDWFVIYRFAVNLLYLQLSRLGVGPVSRYRLCHLVATALEERGNPTTTTTATAATAMNMATTEEGDS
ncbi:hypothetical protein OG217_01425 [Streptomyces sp. NBC_01023]|uniref:lantibiotic dehydratase C-terminal domain-containing protein n=1 Tax=Streptomyces sp. NBC_01023 TaxID=2903724 RepID=UPI00386B4C9B|nr:hypothetical protein OG217_01425 [Streptomyces sp. NBC_01023]